LIGRTLAHYRITAAIGAGGMGEVYRATDTKLARELALRSGRVLLNVVLDWRALVAPASSQSRKEERR